MFAVPAICFEKKGRIDPGIPPAEFDPFPATWANFQGKRKDLAIDRGSEINQIKAPGFAVTATPFSLCSGLDCRRHH